MNYVRSLFLNFLVVFFVDRVAPGVQISFYEHVPNIGADLLFSAIVGFFNASIFFCLALFDLEITNMKLGVISFLISFGAFILIAIVPMGVSVINAWGVIVGGGIVWAAAFLSNYLEWQHYKNV